MGHQQHKCFCDNKFPYQLLIRLEGFFERLVLSLCSVSLAAIGLW